MRSINDKVIYLSGGEKNWQGMIAKNRIIVIISKVTEVIKDRI